MTTAPISAALDSARAHSTVWDTGFIVNPESKLLHLPTRMSEPCRKLFLGFIERLEQFGQVCQSGDPHQTLDTQFPRLLSEIKARFDHEEHLMRATDFGDDSVLIHTAQHQEMLLALQALHHQRLAVGYTHTATAVGRYVMHQLLFHVSYADCELARRLLGLTLDRGDTCHAD